MDVNRLAEVLEHQVFNEELQKYAQQSGLMSTLEGLAVPALLGIGGYAGARALGQEQYTGVPNWLMGPAAGIGLGVPLYRGIRSLASRWGGGEGGQDQSSVEYQRALQQELAAQSALEAQSRAMMEQTMQGMYGGQYTPGVYTSGIPEGYKMGSDELANKLRERQKTAAGELRIPMAQVDQRFQQLARGAKQQQMQQMQQHMQQAAVAQIVKGQFRGLQEQQRRAAKQQMGIGKR